MSLRVAGVVDLASWTDIPLTVDANVSKVVTFETQLMVAGMVAREWSVNQYTVNGPSGINFVTEFGTLKGQLDFGGEWGRESRWKGLWVGRCGQLFDISFQVISKFGHLHLVEGRE